MVKKNRISKLTIVLISLIVIAFILTLIYIMSKINKLKEITSSIKIPDGFYYVGGDINTGIIISDSEKDEFKGVKYNRINKLKGNQFVWVPVEKAIANSFEEVETLIKQGKNPIAIKNQDKYIGIRYNFNSYSHGYNFYFNVLDNIEPYVENELNSEAQYEFNKMVEQVEKNKGFYISRFEVGNLSNAINNDGKVVSKAGEDDITYQNWIDLYKALKEMYNRDDITTEMIWGCQWDAALVWMSNNAKLNEYIYNSKNIGNYYNILEKTGSNPDYCINNIYDMAGNAFEWTQRGNPKEGKEALGGCYSIDSAYFLYNTRTYEITSPWKEVGTRMTMYVN
jgi:hypothetical protein